MELEERHLRFEPWFRVGEGILQGGGGEYNYQDLPKEEDSALAEATIVGEVAVFGKHLVGGEKCQMDALVPFDFAGAIAVAAVLANFFVILSVVFNKNLRSPLDEVISR